ncbi:hypothetical protein [Pseudomonas prosekii]|uniref:hypothetical protein n=1 Tax=Pseudomonas prosekii TaxID=1148509 RepID=UPI003F75456E
MLNMDIMESTANAKVCTDRVLARIRSRKASLPPMPRARSLAVTSEAKPSKELNAVVLANTLVGYGDNISLDNMAIIENLIKFSKLEATFEVPGDDPQAWYMAFLTCMDESGCFVADMSYNAYKKSSMQLTMENIVVDIVQAGVAAAKTTIPGAAVLSAIADTTLDSMKKTPEAISLFNREVISSKGVRLAIMPCDQLANGIILTSLSSIDSLGGSKETNPLFFNWKTAGRDFFQGSTYITFNPTRYAALKGELEEYLGQYYKAALNKRFQRRRNAIS